MTSNPEMIVRDIRIIVMILYRVSCTAFQADFAIPRHSGVDGRFTKVRLGGRLRSRDNLCTSQMFNARNLRPDVMSATSH